MNDRHEDERDFSMDDNFRPPTVHDILDAASRAACRERTKRLIEQARLVMRDDAPHFHEHPDREQANT